MLRALALLPPGRALDLACGDGHNSLALARAGWQVEAWDVSPVALRLVRERATAEGLRVETREVDLEEALPRPAERCDLALLIDFLQRGLHARLEALVRPGGCLLLSTFTVDHAGEHPSRRFRLERGELAAGVAGFTTLLHEESGGRAGLLARRE